MSGIAVTCPKCGSEGSFSKGFVFLRGEEARQAKDNPAISGVQLGVGYMVALYPKILPWKHPSNRWLGRYSRETWGICKCPKCGYLNKHKLNWPDDAYYKIVVSGKVLWGWNRKNICDLRDYFLAKDRKRWAHWYSIRQIPTEFKLAKHRDEVVKKLEKLLREK